MAKTLSREEESLVQEIDKNVRNKFRWEWLQRSVTVKVKIGKNVEDVTEKLESFVKKCDIPGKALCTYCNEFVNYGSRGCIAFVDHATKVEKHAQNLKTRRTNYSLGSVFAKKAGVTDTSHWGTLAKPTGTGESESEPLTPIADRQVHSETEEALVLSVIAEHSLPLSLAPVIVQTARELAKDPRALSCMKLERKTAGYKMTHGLGKTFSEETATALQSGPFSLNIDESTSNSDKRILAILASYFSVTQNKVVVEHLRSIEVFKVDTKSILNAIDKLFDDMEIPWENLVSILMDSCNVMRGSKNGLETQIRRDRATHLLDIDGDSCHHVHNACKKFCLPFEGWVEGLANDLHNDLMWSTDLRQLFMEMCEMLDIPFTMPKKFIAHRWLSCYDSALANIVMKDAFQIFYYGFLKGEEKNLYREPVMKIVHQKLTADGLRRINDMWHLLSEKKSTADGHERKRRIIKKVLFQSKKTDMIMAFYTAVLGMLKEFTCLFQTKTPMIHVLHDKQIQLFSDFLACFMKPQVIAGKTAAQLKLLNLTDENQHLSLKNMFIGIQVEKVIKESHPNDTTVAEFLKLASKAYILGAEHLQKKLPLDSKLLRLVSAIDPAARGHSETVKCLKQLGTNLSHFLTDEEQGRLPLEAHKFQVDSAPAMNEVLEVDQWWAAVDNQKYPALCKLVKVVLTCFHGPMVESSFNLMGDIIDPRSSRMNVDTFNAFQTVKYALKANGSSALKLFSKHDVKHTKVNKSLCINMRAAAREQKRKWEDQKTLKEERVKRLKTSDISAPPSTVARNNIQVAEKTAQQKKRIAIERLTALAAKRKNISLQ